MERRGRKILEGAPGKTVSPGAPSKTFRIFHCDRTICASAPYPRNPFSVTAVFQKMNSSRSDQLQTGALQYPSAVPGDAVQ